MAVLTLSAEAVEDQGRKMDGSVRSTPSTDSGFMGRATPHEVDPEEEPLPPGWYSLLTELGPCRGKGRCFKLLVRAVQAVHTSWEVHGIQGR